MFTQENVSLRPKVTTILQDFQLAGQKQDTTSRFNLKEPEILIPVNHHNRKKRAPEISGSPVKTNQIVSVS
jgi:hypothetical protein